MFKNKIVHRQTRKRRPPPRHTPPIKIKLHPIQQINNKRFTLWPTLRFRFWSCKTTYFLLSYILTYASDGFGNNKWRTRTYTFRLWSPFFFFLSSGKLTTLIAFCINSNNDGGDDAFSSSMRCNDLVGCCCATLACFTQACQCSFVKMPKRANKR